MACNEYLLYRIPAFFLSWPFPSLKLGYRNRVISLFYLAHLDDRKLFTINHFVTKYRFSQKSIYWMVHRVDEIHCGVREIFDLGRGSGQPQAGWQERMVPKTVGTKNGASTHHQARRFNITPRNIQNVL